MANRLSATCIALLAFAIAPAAQAEDAVYEALEEPNHRPIYHDRRFDIYDVRLSGGEQSFYHTHRRDQLGIVISTSTSFNLQLGGAEVRTTAERGTISYIPHSTLGGYTHRVRVGRGSQFRVIGIEFAAAAGPGGKRLTLPPNESRLTFPQGSITRLSIPPGKSVALEGTLLIAMSSGTLSSRSSASRWDFGPGDVKPLGDRRQSFANTTGDTVSLLAQALSEGVAPHQIEE